jgi:hypothetical protein
MTDSFMAKLIELVRGSKDARKTLQRKAVGDTSFMSAVQTSTRLSRRGESAPAGNIRTVTGPVPSASHKSDSASTETPAPDPGCAKK